jgi:hypothetical protein
MSLTDRTNAPLLPVGKYPPPFLIVPSAQLVSQFSAEEEWYDQRIDRRPAIVIAAAFSAI